MNRSVVKIQNQEYTLEVFSAEELANISPETKFAIADCYMEVFNESWGEKWTIAEAESQIDALLSFSEERSPLLSLLWYEHELAGFACGSLTHTKNLVAEKDMPFSLSSEKKEEALLVSKYWLSKIVKQESIFIFSEYGAKKKFRNGVSSFSALAVLSLALENGCKTLLFWTNEKSAVFKIGLCVGWYPIHYCITDDLIIMGGNIVFSIQNIEYITKTNGSFSELYKKNALKYLS